MGALRAAELAEFGMLGIGEVYREFANGQLDGDDEVAVAHLGEAHQYRQISDSMVDIRHTLRKAVRIGIIDGVTADEIVGMLKAAHFPSRRLVEAVEQAQKIFPGEAEALRDWIECGNFVQQKRRDAVLALNILRDKVPDKTLRPSVQWTRYISFLAREVSCTPFRNSYDWLPANEKQYAAITEAQPVFGAMLECFAEAMHFAYHIILSGGSSILTSDAICDATSWIKVVDSWEAAGPVGDQIALWIKGMVATMGLPHRWVSAGSALLVLEATRGYEFDGESSIEELSRVRIAATYLALIQLCLGNVARVGGLTLAGDVIGRKLDRFRNHNGLCDSVAMGQFLQENQVSKEEFGAIFSTVENYRAVFCDEHYHALIETDTLIQSVTRSWGALALECVLSTELRSSIVI